MLCEGEWSLGDDGISRPVLNARILGSDGAWRSIEFLLDTGADGTVITANMLGELNLQRVESKDQIGGVGGFVDSVNVTTQIGLQSSGGQWITLRGAYAACLRSEALDMSVIGRDILNLFAVIVDRPGDRVALLHGNDHYLIKRRS